jgi:hypothetical protein
LDAATRHVRAQRDADIFTRKVRRLPYPFGPSLMKKPLALLVSLLLSTSLFAAKQAGDFPRLLGMNIGKKHYDDPAYQAQLAKLDIVILGFFPGWNPRNESDPIGSVLRNLKRLNPAIKIGQYTILNEAYDDPTFVTNQDIRDVLNAHHWCLLNAAGK